MNKNIAIDILFLVLINFACTKDTHRSELAFLNKSIENINNINNYEWIVILPGIGCHGCIQEGEFFMKENINNEKILYILTKTSSLKLLQQKTGIELNKHFNIYIDKEFMFDIPSDNGIYPCVIRLEHGKIKQFDFQSPENAAFYKMKQSLD